jgi:hypothetical protein
LVLGIVNPIFDAFATVCLKFGHGFILILTGVFVAVNSG